MLIDLTAAGFDLITTELIGWLCGAFLDKSVPVKQTLIPDIKNVQKDGGGLQLGVIERLLFFAAFWSPPQYILAVGWFASKVAAKWAAWQHIVRIPDNAAENALRQRTMLSSYLLGRFLNGTLFNGLCAAMGVIFAKIILSSEILKSELVSPIYWIFIGVAAIESWLVFFALFSKPPAQEVSR
jgi:hypothetical protein